MFRYNSPWGGRKSLFPNGGDSALLGMRVYSMPGDKPCWDGTYIEDKPLAMPTNADYQIVASVSDLTLELLCKQLALE
jgi:hypothetical protein